MKLTTILTLLVFLVCATFSYADIISNTIADDGDGVITCSLPYGMTSLGNHEFEVYIDGVHNSWNPGHIQGDIISDSETIDPKLTLDNEIDNDTGFAWTDYHVKVTMTKSFTFDNVGVNNTGWTVDAINQPAQVGSYWIGTIDYIGASNPILVSGALDFNYRMTYLGSTWFQEELMPTPEPGTFVLLACGLIGLLMVRRRFA